MSRDRRRPAAGGFTLAEMLVVWVLVLLALAVAADLLLDSQRVMRSAEGEARRVGAWPVGRQLRYDLQEARWPLGATDFWQSGPLALGGLPAGTVVYQRQGNELVRTVLDAAGQPGVPRRLATDVQQWRWRSPQPGLVDVELARGSAPAARLELRVALRGAGKDGTW